MIRNTSSAPLVATTDHQVCPKHGFEFVTSKNIQDTYPTTNEAIKTMHWPSEVQYYLPRTTVNEEAPGIFTQERCSVTTLQLLRTFLASLQIPAEDCTTLPPIIQPTINSTLNFILAAPQGACGSPVPFTSHAQQSLTSSKVRAL